MSLRRRAVAFALLFSSLALAAAQTPAGKPPLGLGPNGSYDPRITFAPLTLPDPVNSYRSSNGTPGPAFWQNRADYEMHATLDTSAKVLHNDEVITYTNNSPDALASLWVLM